MTSKRRAGRDGRYEWRKCTVGKQIDMRIRGLLAAACLAPTPALAQALNYTTFGNPGSMVTTVTGIRGNGMTGDFTTGTGGSTAGVLYTLPSLTPAPYPNASAPPVNFTGATTNTPYGPSFGSASGILRGVGSYKSHGLSGADVRRSRLSLRRRQRARPAAHDAARRPQRLQHDRPLDLRQPARRQLGHRQRRRGQRLPLQHRHRRR